MCLDAKQFLAWETALLLEGASTGSIVSEFPGVCAVWLDGVQEVATGAESSREVKPVWKCSMIDIDC